MAHTKHNQSDTNRSKSRESLTGFDLRDRAKTGLDQVLRSIRNPSTAQVAIAGAVGLVALGAAASRSERVRAKANDAKDAAGRAAHKLGETASELKSNIAEKARDGKARLSEAYEARVARNQEPALASAKLSSKSSKSKDERIDTGNIPEAPIVASRPDEQPVLVH